MPVMIAIAALIDISYEAHPAILLAAAPVGLPQFIVIELYPGNLRQRGLENKHRSRFLSRASWRHCALTTGLFLSVICTLIYRAVKKASFKEAFLLVPYLSVGYAVGYAAVILFA